MFEKRGRGRPRKDDSRSTAARVHIGTMTRMSRNGIKIQRVKLVAVPLVEYKSPLVDLVLVPLVEKVQQAAIEEVIYNFSPEKDLDFIVSWRKPYELNISPNSFVSDAEFTLE